jgi:hypothetical protein
MSYLDRNPAIGLLTQLLAMGSQRRDKSTVVNPLESSRNWQALENRLGARLWIERRMLQRASFQDEVSDTNDSLDTLVVAMLRRSSLP